MDYYRKNHILAVGKKIDEEHIANDIVGYLEEVKPDIVIIVPIIIENIVKDSIFKYTKNRHIATIYSMFKHVLNKLIKKRLISAFGGNFYQIIIGGAYLDNEVERYLNELYQGNRIHS